MIEQERDDRNHLSFMMTVEQSALEHMQFLIHWKIKMLNPHANTRTHTSEGDLLLKILEVRSSNNQGTALKTHDPRPASLLFGNMSTFG